MSAIESIDVTATNAPERLKQLGRAVLEKYGLPAKELAAQWYDYCHELEISSGYTAGIGEVSRYSLESDFGALCDRFAAGEVVESDFVAQLGGILVNQVHREARNTIMANLSEEFLQAEAQGDHKLAGKIGYSRVPVADACAFCVLLASRSFYPWQQYNTARTAGEGRKYHDDCRCVIVPFAKAMEIRGYSEKLDEYNTAYRDADNMRRANDLPDELQERIAIARAEHKAKFERGEVTEPWRSINEDLIIMRWNNPTLH